MSKTCVVTGIYQLLHRGHINLLEKAAEYGHLIVLLNNDAGTLALKGYLAEPYRERKRKLLETGLVSCVLEFYTNPTSWLRFLEPDYLIAGSDHTEDEIMSKGGIFAKEIIILPRTPGISSRELYKKAQQ